MKNKRWLCYQMIVTSQEQVGNNNNIGMGTIIRNIGAKSKEEAIGKFILKTGEIIASKKLDPICFELETLKTID